MRKHMLITVMSNPRLPPETLDYIVDFLHDDPQTLKNCCLVAKSRVPRAREHLFNTIEISSLTGLEGWCKVFPDPSGSPGCHVRSLCLNSVHFIPSVIAGGCSLVRPFSNIVRLCGKGILHARSVPHLLNGSRTHPASGPGLISSQFFELICSLPLLDDLAIDIHDINKADDDGPLFQPLASPPLTGTLIPNMFEEIEYIARGLLGLPSGIHFRRLWCAWNFEEDFQWTTALVDGCSNTLEYLEIYRDGPFFPSVVGPATDLNSL